MEIITNAENRKELVKALSGHFGQRSEYLGPPSFAYRIGSITVDRDAKVCLLYTSMGKWWLAVFPGMMLVLTVVLFEKGGTALRQLLDPGSVHK